jgi:hypothetical protein
MPETAGSKYRDCAKGRTQIRGGSPGFRDTALGASLGNVISLVSTSDRSVACASGRAPSFADPQSGVSRRRRPHGYVRHPQYIGFVLVMFGFLLQWPTLITLAMFPVLVAMYVHLACVEEREALKQFGDDYRRNMARTPGYFPRIAALRSRDAL